MPEMFKWKSGLVVVDCDGNDTYGLTYFQPRNNGKHRYAYEADTNLFLKIFIERVLGEEVVTNYQNIG